MNLWVKRAGQLCLAAVLFFCSCEEDTSLLGYRNPNKKFSVNYIEIPVGVSVFKTDTLITDNLEALHRLMIGEYSDPELGEVKCNPYLEFLPASSTQLNSTSVYDSVTFELQLDFYSYGQTGDGIEKFTLHELLDTMTYSNSNRYNSRSTVPYNPTPIGEASVSVNYDSLKKQLTLPTADRDTIIARARLDQNFGQRLFDVALNNTDSLLNKSTLFRNEFKGLALIPSQSQAIVGYNLYSSLTQIVLHYHTMEGGVPKDTLQRVFSFTLRSFNHIETDRSGTELEGVTNSYQSYPLPGSNSYVQSGSPIFTRLDLSRFYELADTVPNMIINSAELLITDVTSPTATPVHNSFTLRPMFDTPLLFADRTLDTDIDSLAGLYVYTNVSAVPADKYFYVRGDFGSTDVRAVVSYDAEKERYSSYVTLFLQTMFVQKASDTRLRYLGLYPNSPAPESSVNRTVFNKDNVRLKIYYTRPTTSNQ